MVFVSYDHNWDTFPAYQLNACKQKRLNYSGRTEIVFLWNDSGEYWDSMAAGSDEYSNQRMIDRGEYSDSMALAYSSVSPHIFPDTYPP